MRRRYLGKIDLPENVNRIIKKLHHSGFEGFAVGGCVRDSLLGKTPADWDITTNALPEEIKKIFKKTVDTGIAHGTVTVLVNGTGYELTTYRIDGKYSDGRHPDSVSFSTELSEDLCRRDFTINAMAYSEKKGIIDLYDGITDLNNNIIRAVGDPCKRFEEDALRMLRAIRFAAQLGFIIEENTFEAIKKRAALLSNVSKERIFVELNKSFTGDFSENFKLIYETGLYKYIGGEFSNIPPQFYNIYSRKLGSKKYIYWVIFLRKISDTWKAKTILSDLKSDNITIKNTCLLIDELKLPVPKTDEKIRHTLHRIGYELFEDYINILKTDREHSEISNILPDVEKRYEIIKKEKHAINIAMLDITGKELIEMGIPKGPGIGEILEYLLKRVIENPELNHRKKLIEMAEKVKSHRHL